MQKSRLFKECDFLKQAGCMISATYRTAMRSTTSGDTADASARRETGEWYAKTEIALCKLINGRWQSLTTPTTGQTAYSAPSCSGFIGSIPDIPELSPHELRHTRDTLWIAQGIDPYMVARLLRHSGLKMLTRMYDHTSTETLRKALLGARPAAGPKKGEL